MVISVVSGRAAAGGDAIENETTAARIKAKNFFTLYSFVLR
jgi:hypothetical protein